MQKAITALHDFLTACNEVRYAWFWHYKSSSNLDCHVRFRAEHAIWQCDLTVTQDVHRLYANTYVDICVWRNSKRTNRNALNALLKRLTHSSKPVDEILEDIETAQQQAQQQKNVSATSAATTKN